ncbi:unnamed protein product [Rotaria sp. Silwood2]|nr:unnamed protein product [Rotaria sp. Silwood2]
MCEQSLVNYCSHKSKEQGDSTITPYLFSMNLLAVALWYLKHYHAERYIAIELNLIRSTVNYIFSEAVDILHSCVYPELISLPADMSNRTTVHGPEEHHKLIVDSTCIAIPQPYDLDQRKAYYHSKSLTNYTFQIQIVCDFSHRLVHISECYHDSVHDITILRELGLLEHTEETVQIIADKGYVGEEYVITPRKKPRRGELTDEDKNFNRDINNTRAAIENINQRLKTYAILGGVCREACDDPHKITKIVHAVSALCNLSLDQHKAYYHSKNPPIYAFKIQIACDFSHRILHVSEFCHGSVHDIKILRESGLLEHTEKTAQIIADKGFVGEEYVTTPRKKPRRGELTDEDNNFNRDINSTRAAIENINQRLKIYANLGGVYSVASQKRYFLIKYIAI